MEIRVEVWDGTVKPSWVCWCFERLGMNYRVFPADNPNIVAVFGSKKRKVFKLGTVEYDFLRSITPDVPTIYCSDDLIVRGILEIDDKNIRRMFRHHLAEKNYEKCRMLALAYLL